MVKIIAGLFKTNYRAITWLNLIQALTPAPQKKALLKQCATTLDNVFRSNVRVIADLCVKSLSKSFKQSHPVCMCFSLYHKTYSCDKGCARTYDKGSRSKVMIIADQGSRSNVMIIADFYVYSLSGHYFLFLRCKLLYSQPINCMFDKTCAMTSN